MQSFKAQTNNPGYDLIATNPELNLSCRIQVKSWWATDYDGGFLIRQYSCDFVVLALLNRGYRYRKRAAAEDDGVRPPQFYVFPVDVVRAARHEKSEWGKVFLRNMADPSQHLENWEAIEEFLSHRRADG
jgi:hypothetical protein